MGAERTPGLDPMDVQKTEKPEEDVKKAEEKAYAGKGFREGAAEKRKEALTAPEKPGFFKRLFPTKGTDLEPGTKASSEAEARSLDSIAGTVEDHTGAEYDKNKE